MQKREEILKVLAPEIRRKLSEAPVDFEKLQEIRLRSGQPLRLLYENREYALVEGGALQQSGNNACVVTQKEIRETMEYISNYSLYAFEDELRQGFLTIQGGHRVGVAGKIILEGDRIKCMKYISFLNIRLSHQIKGCADPVLPWITHGKELYHTMILSPPGCGKTTLLRDIVRQLSDGFGTFAGLNVAVVDERSEIGACYMGIPQNDLGSRTDVLDCCPKADGMMMMIRSMSPKVVAVDEIGSARDLEAIRYAVKCGCRILATVHAGSMEDVRKRPVLGEFLEEGGFERFIILNGGKRAGFIEAVCDREEALLYSGRERERRAPL